MPKQQPAAFTPTTDLAELARAFFSQLKEGTNEVRPPEGLAPPALDAAPEASPAARPDGCDFCEEEMRPGHAYFAVAVAEKYGGWSIPLCGFCHDRLEGHWSLQGEDAMHARGSGWVSIARWARGNDDVSRSPYEQCVRALLCPAFDVKEKAGYFTDWLDEYERKWRMLWERSWWTNVPPRWKHHARESAESNLFTVLEGMAGYHPSATDDLRIALNDIDGYLRERQRAHAAGVQEDIDRLRALPPGTAVVIDRIGIDEVVRVVEVKRTGFVGEYLDGRRYRVPAEAFLRVHDGPVPLWLSDDERERREVIRKLGGGQFAVVKAGLLAQGVACLPSLLDELSAAIDRVTNAPSGPAGGRLGPYLGIITKTNTHDQALVKRIPRVVMDIAESADFEVLLELLIAHPDDKVRSVMNRVL
jgi:hypothetical protein